MCVWGIHCEYVHLVSTLLQVTSHLSTHVGTSITSGVARMSKLCGHSMGTFSACVNMHLLGELGHEIFLKLLTLRLLLSSFFLPFFSLTECSLHFYMKGIAHANNWSLTYHSLSTQTVLSQSFHIFLSDTSEFYVGAGPVMIWCSYATAWMQRWCMYLHVMHSKLYMSIIINYSR